MLDQVEQARLGPVEVVEHDDQRSPLGQQLQQPPERPGASSAGAAADSSPISCATRVATCSRSRSRCTGASPDPSGAVSSSRRSLAEAPAGGSVSVMPAAWRTISATGQ